MMIKLCAISKKDGWAVIQTPEGLRLLRPPYTEDQCPFLHDSDVIRLLSEPGFDAVIEEPTMPDLASVITHLKTTMVETNAEEPLAHPKEVGRFLLQTAPPDFIRHSLERIQNELLPQRQFIPSIKVLRILEESDAAKADPLLHDDVKKLLNDAMDSLESDNNDISGTNILDYFARARKIQTYHTPISEDIQREGQILKPAA
ncbi:MAG: hypothetical protein HQL85_19510 [Magnetococcales bacterium]|nr:hypothetical protein [Magnetococcales bacterium]MBF0631462.1 hypothetical protein [Magnetococcales bacterium]